MYRVIREFTYGDKKYEPGSTWEPQGERNDKSIIACGRYVIAAMDKPKPQKKAKKEEETA